MSDWIELARAIGDLFYLLAAIITFYVVLSQRRNP